MTATSTATGTITTNDDTAPPPPPAVVTIADASASEGDAITFTVTLDRAVAGGFTVTPSFTDGTATKGTDYTENTAGLSFAGAAGETQSFSVSTTEDADVEGDETFTVSLAVSGTAESVTATSTATGTITNDDTAPPPPPAVVTIADASASEGDAITFTVTLDRAVSGGFTVTPSFTDGTATKGTDYTENTTGLSFAGTAGETQTFAVSTTEDSDVEGDETFTVGLSVSGTSHSVTATSTATGTITNDDTAPPPPPAAVTIADASASEGDAITFTVTLDKAVSGGLTVTPSFTDGTATKGTDYTENTAGLSFAGTAGETQSFSVSTTEDTDVEGDETFTVSLGVSGTAESVTATSTATGTITNDDTAPAAAVTIADASASEGDAITFTVTLDKAVSGGLTVTPSFTDGTATKGTDYTENTAALTFAGTANETQTFTVATTEDSDVEGDETFTVGLAVSGTAESVTATSTATGTITNDDTAPAAAVTIADASASEGDAITFTVTLDKAVSGGLTVTPSFTDGTATKGTDYTENTAALTFAGTANETQTFTVSTTEDSDVEGDETFTVGLAVSGTAESVTATSTATGTITNDDTAPPPPPAAVTIADASASEGDAITFTVTLDSAVSGGLTVTPSFTDGTATKGTDYTENTAALTFAGTANETQTFTVATTEDTDVEGDETFTVGLTVSGTSHSVTATSTATGTITNDDTAPAAAVTIADASASEGDAITFTVTLDKAVAGGLTVTPSFTDGTATKGTDYTENTAALTFAGTANETQTFTVSTTEDADVEGDETFTVGLAVSGTSESVTATSTATGTITNDDTAPAAAVTIADASASEGDAITFTVTLDKAVAGGLTVTPSFTDGTATKGTDYTENTAALTFAGTANETQTFTVSTTEDTDVEGDETFTVGLAVSGTSESVTATSTATGTITNDDTAPAAAVTIADASASEGDAITFTVTLDKAVSGGLTVTPSFTDGTATKGTDYTENTAALTFAGTANETQTFTVSTTEDTDVEPDETFTVGLAVSGTSESVTATSTATGTITNDDTAPAAAVTIADASASEGDAITFTVTLDSAVSGGLTVTPSFTDGTATKGTDYTENTAALTFTGTANETQMFTVSTTEDSDVEGDETFTVGLAVSGTSESVTATSTATGTITNDDIANVVIDGAIANEGDDITFSVTLDKAVPGGFTVTPTFTDGTATKGTDYTENTTAISFAGTANESHTFTVSTTEDTDAEDNETFTVGLSISGTSMNVRAPSTATGTIRDDDEVTSQARTTVTLSVDVSRISESSGERTVTVTARHDSGRDAFSAAVTVQVGGGTATEGTDYDTVNDFTVSIPPYSSSGSATFKLKPKQDTQFEGHETISVSGTAFGNNVTGTTITLTDDDIELSVSPRSVYEDDGATTVTVTASAGASSSARTVSVSVGKGGDGATEGTDYSTVNDFNLTIAANATSGTGTFTLTPTNDNVLEGNETITVSGSVANHTVNATSVTLVDINVISLSVNPSTVREDAGRTSVTLTATAGSATSSARTVRVSVGRGTATEGTDYMELWDFNLTIAASQTSGTATFYLSPIQDASREQDETILISGSISGYTVNGATLTLQDDDTVPDVDLDLNTHGLSEGGGAKTITVTLHPSRERGWGRTITVQVGKSGDGATEGTDYTTVADFDIRIPPYSASGSGSFTLTPTQDTDLEGTEAITVSGSHSSESVSAEYVQLYDDDATTFTLSANKTSVSEGASATSVTVTATAATAQSSATAVTVRVGNNSTATSGTDYATVNDFTITIPANQTSATGTFTLTPTQDTEVEGNEAIRVDGSAGYHSVTGTSLTLSDDDTYAVTLSASPSSVSEGASGTTVTVTATATSSISSARSVTVAVGGSGTATSGTDYAAVSDFTVTIAANATSGTGTFTLTPTNDSSVEGDETIGIAGTGTQMTVTGTSLTLSEDDTYAVTLSASPTSVGEADAATTVTVTATAAAISSARTVTVAVGVTGDAVVAEDFATVSDFTITIAANATSGTGTFTLTPTQDTSAEGNETIGITGSGTLMTVTGTSMTLTDDDVRTIELSSNKSSVSEGAGATTVTVTATANSAVSEATAVTVSVGASGDGATEGTDYSTVSDFTVTIAANKTNGTGTFTLTPTQETTYEADESISVTGSSSPHTVTGTSLDITNDDGIAITLSASPDSVIEGGGATTVTVKASTGSTEALQAITVGVQVGKSSDSATEGTDYPTVNDFNLTIAEGDSTGTATFSLIPNSDKKDKESNETISIDGSSSPHTVTGTSMTLVNATATNPITLSVNPSSINEDAGATTVTVTARMQASFQGAGSVTVTVGTSGSAKSGTDYAAVSDITLNFSAGSPTTATGTFTLTPTDDAVVEKNETVWVDGTSAWGQVVGASVTINDNDGAAITLSANKTSVGEGASGTSVTVTATAGATSSSARTVTVAVGKNGDGAIEGTDYSDVSDFTISIAANATSGTGSFTLTPTQDNVVEGSEKLTISGSGTGLNVTGTSVTITDDDTAPAVNLSVSPTSFTEGASDPSPADGKTVTVTAAFSTTKTYASDQTVTVSVGGSGTATSGTDYDAVSNFNVKINAGQQSGTATFTLKSADDNVYEGDETIGVAGTATGLTVNSANLTLADNDNAAVTINDASAAEGSDITFTVTLDNAVQGGLTVTPGFTDGTAVEGTDYDENTADLSFTGTANETQTFTVSTTQDAVVETNETFTVGLSVSDAPSGVTSTDTGTGTIDDNASGNVDSAALTINDASADEGGGITFTVTLDNAVQGGFTVTPSFTDGTAVEGTDYDENTSGLSFTGTANETKTFTVSTTEDAVLEANETFTVGLSVSGTTLASRITVTDTGTGTINNDDGATVTVANASASEGDSITFTVTLGAAVQGGLTVTPDFTDGTAVEGTDYDENTGALAFTGTANETRTFKVATTEDEVLEANETFTVGLSISGTTLNITSSDTGTGTVTNDDAAEVTVNDASASEGDSISFTVTLDKAVQGGLTVTPGYTNGTAASGDYTKNTTAVSFSGTANETKTFKVATKEDAVLEAGETFTVGLTVSDAPSGVTSTDTGTGTIDNDDAATVTINDASASEGAGITFTITLDKAVQGGLKVTPGYTNGTAASGDYTANTTAVSFAGTANETRTFTVSTKEDAVLESNETFTVGLTVSDAPTGVTSTDTGVGTINDDDSADLSLTDPSGSEGESLTFTVTLNAAVQGGLAVTPGFTDGTAVEGTDYDENTTTLDFTGTKGETKSFTVATIEDAVLEADETFTVGLTVSKTSLDIDASATGTGTIDNDDSAEVTVAHANASEGESLTFTVTLSEAVQGGLTVTPGFTDVTAVEGTDYDENTPALSFTGTKGETKSFTVSTTEDNVVESDETFTVGLTVSGTQLGVGSTDTGTGTIDDDDQAPDVDLLVVGGLSVGEGEPAKSMKVTAAFSNGNTFPVDTTVTVGVGGGTATQGTDFETVPDFEITIKALQLSASGSFTLAPIEDRSVEGNETIELSGSVPGLTVNIDGVTIVENDAASDVRLSVDPAVVKEGAATTVTVTAELENGNTFPEDRTVTVSVGGGTAAADADYAAVSGFDIVIPKDQLSGTGTFTLAPVNDGEVEGDETVEVTGVAGSLAVHGAAITLSDDNVYGVALSASPSSVDEDAAATEVTVTATAESADAAARVVTVTVGADGDDAAEGTDYAAVGDFQVTIPANVEERDGDVHADSDRRRRGRGRRNDLGDGRELAHGGEGDRGDAGGGRPPRGEPVGGPGAGVRGGLRDAGARDGVSGVGGREGARGDGGGGSRGRRRDGGRGLRGGGQRLGDDSGERDQRVQGVPADAGGRRRGRGRRGDLGDGLGRVHERGGHGAHAGGRRQRRGAPVGEPGAGLRGRGRDDGDGDRYGYCGGRDGAHGRRGGRRRHGDGGRGLRGGGGLRGDDSGERDERERDVHPDSDRRRRGRGRRDDLGDGLGREPERGGHQHDAGRRRPGRGGALGGSRERGRGSHCGRDRDGVPPGWPRVRGGAHGDGGRVGRHGDGGRGLRGGGRLRHRHSGGRLGGKRRLHAGDHGRRRDRGRRDHPRDRLLAGDRGAAGRDGGARRDRWWFRFRGGAGGAR